MSAWVGWGLLVGALVAAVVLVAWIYRVLDRRERHVNEVIDRALDDMDQSGRFEVSPPDWPIRESPPVERRR